MTWVEQYRTQARYNAWMNDKLYATASQLSDEQRTRDLGAFFRSIHGTFNHLLLTDCMWLARFTRDESFLPRTSDGRLIPFQSLEQQLYEDFDELRTQRQRLDERLCAWVDTLSEAALQAEMTYQSSTGVARRHPLWIGLSHFFNHQTHHRGQITTLFSQLGKDPGVTDLVAMYCADHR